MLKRILFVILMSAAATAYSQLNNSWIDFGKTYYKFYLSKDTFCRIPQSAIASIGLASVTAKDFQLWRNGKEVRMYAPVSNTPLGANDYLEFWGEMNDGKPDNPLYRNSDYQLVDKYSLETDTAAYFLTVNTGGNNLRYIDGVNSAPSAATPDAYFMRDIDYYYKYQINRGEAKPVGEYVYSSSFDMGEGWSSTVTAPCCDLVKEFFNLNVFTGGPANSVSVRVNAVGAAPNNRDIRIKLNQNDITASPYGSPITMNYFDYRKINLENLPLSLLSQNSSYLPVFVNGNSTNIYDRIVVASIGLTYPATFNFNNEKYFSFKLAPSATGNYLVISNFNYGAIAPVLYDLTSGIRYTGEIASSPGQVKFVLPPSAQSRNFMLMNREQPMTITSMVRRNFTDLTTASNQGNYLIISNPLLYNDGSGNNPVEEYRQYRASVTGGGYNAKVFDISELNDQFAFGISHHPSAIRDFISYARANFSQAPEYVFIIGRGVNYIDQLNNTGNPAITTLDLVQTFGWPPSDVLLSSPPGTTVPQVPIGRLGAISATEVSNYLLKIKEYETAQFSNASTIGDKAWMKNFIHVAGGKDSLENVTFKGYMNAYKDIAEDTLMGAYVETFTKTSAGAVQQANSQRIEQLFDEGLGFVGYFGHSSANTFEFNLSNPDIYNNAGKYPFFNVSGCSAGNFYVYDPLRLNGNMSLSEKYVLAHERGSIGFLADTHFGIPPFLNFFNNSLYNKFSRTMYGNTIGNQIKSVTEDLGGNNSGLDFFTRMHLEEINLHGDPAIKINSFAKPDFAVEDQSVKISPSIISVADNNFNLKVVMRNIGRAVGDSIQVSVKQKLPNDSVRVIFSRLIPSIRNLDSLDFTVPIFPATDKGLNRIIVTLDETGRVDEQYETNNSITKEFYIFEDELRPSWPGNFSIVNRQNIRFVSSTANPLSGNRDYVMEVDTTELFNSPFRKIYNQSGPGGIVEFVPNNLNFTDSTVYYWRVAMVPRNGAQYIWNSFSFVYLQGSSPGYNQSHYYQYGKSKYDEMTLDNDRIFRFKSEPRNLVIRTGLYPYFDYDRINVNLDFTQLESYGCIYNSMQFYVFDTVTLTPWKNYNVTPTNGRYGSYRVCRRSSSTDTTRKFFEFPYNSFSYRKSAMDFIDSIPDGMYVAITNLGVSTSANSFISTWQADTAVLGSGRSLYHKLKSIGFTAIDSFNRNLPFLYFFRKGSGSYPSRQIMGPADSTYIEESFNLNSISTQGSMESPVFGPSVSWSSVHWRGTSADPAATDTIQLDLVGIRNDGTAQTLATVYPSQDSSLNFINAAEFPYLKVFVRNQDPVNITPTQLRYLRINATPAPEGAVAPALLYQFKDTVDQGEPISFALAFKNISEVAFDSLIKVKLVITDQNNVPHLINVPRRKALVAGDTLQLRYTIDTRDLGLAGGCTLFAEFNPDNDQPEMYHYNNILFNNFHVRQDKYNPLLDVTFDGVHILNKDIVSSKPGILITLKDESRFLALKDTSLISVQVRYPDQSLHPFYFGDKMRFTPADLSSGENKATINLDPYFPEDGEYELIVSGKDVAGNPAGNLDFHVVFNVVNKPMISNLLNYPNPFTTSTAFVFTLTGNDIPQQLRIQILTITGKIVREISRNELGPIHIGRNITEYKWDGTDSYGQQLANGVYLYRVLTNLNGKSLDKYSTSETDTDKYFNKGYGKMYLMR